MNLVFAHLTVAQFAHQRGCAQRDLVHAVLSVHHQDMVCAQALHHPHLDTDQIRMKHSHEGVRRTGWIGQRPQDIKDRAHAQLAAHRCHVLHRRMVIRRKHEPDPGGLQAVGHLRRAQIDARAECFQHIGGTGLRRHPAIAMLGDFRTSSRSNEHGSGRDVEGVQAITAGPDNVNKVLRITSLNPRGELAHHLGRCSDFPDRLFFDPQAGEDGGGHGRRHLTAHDHAHELEHLVVKDLAVLDGPLQGFVGRDRHGQLRRSENFAAGHGHVHWPPTQDETAPPRSTVCDAAGP